MLSPALTPMHPHPSPPAVDSHAPVTDFYKTDFYTLRWKTGGECLKKKKQQVGELGGQSERVSNAEEESKSAIERDEDRKERLGLKHPLSILLSVGRQSGVKPRY